MLRLTIFCFLSSFFGFSALASAEDFAFARTRPLMALCAELRDRYGLLVTYEDAPGDLITEVSSEVHPNGRTFFFPRWKLT